MLTIVDVGASGGLHPRWGAVRPPVRAILFDPDPRAADTMETPEGFMLLTTALSDRVGVIEFHHCRAQQVSSVYKPNLPLLRKFVGPEYLSGYDILESVTIPCDTLDNQLAAIGVSDIDFIKLDVEGHELAIVNGAPVAIRHAIGVEVEVEFLETRKGQPLFHDVHVEMLKAGFELFDLQKSHFKRCGNSDHGPDKGQLLFGNALYLRPFEALGSESKLLALATVYTAYGYRDVLNVLRDTAVTNKALSPAGVAHLESLMRGRRLILPEFKGKGRIHRLMARSARLFGREGRNFVDEGLGNP